MRAAKAQSTSEQGVSAEAMRLLRHMVGDPGRIEQYKELGWRRHGALAGPQVPLGEALVDAGYAVRGDPYREDGAYFFATDDGVQAAERHRAAEQSEKGLRLYLVERSFDGQEWADKVIARSRSAARWSVIRDVVETGWTPREAFSTVRGVLLDRGHRR